MRIAAILGSIWIGLAATAPVRADFVVFKVPTTNIKFVLQGKAVSSRTLPTVNFTSNTRQTFDLPQGADTEVIVTSPLSQIGAKRVLKAKGDSAELRSAAAWNLDHGLLTEFRRALDQLATADANDAFATQAKRLQADLAKPIAAEAPESLKGIAPDGFKSLGSAHFLLFHQDGDKPADKSEIKKKKPEARLEQFEQLLEIFVMKCAERGLPVQVPTHRMKVVLLSRKDPRMIPGARTPGPDPRTLWAHDSNILFYYGEEARVPALDGLKSLQSKVAKVAAQPKTKKGNFGQPGGAGGGAAPAMTAGGTGGGGLDLSQLSAANLAKLTVTVQALIVIGYENADLESTSREAAYMFIANCGVVPPQAPEWVRDGLAAYFEYPAEVGALKIGDLGNVRNAWYQASLQDPDRFTISDIVTGRCHAGPLTVHESMRAGNLSWALLHYLLHKNPEGLAQYLNSFRAMPSDVAINPDLLTALFGQAFGEDRKQVEDDWRQYMTDLKADYLVIQEQEGGATTVEN